MQEQTSLRVLIVDDERAIADTLAVIIAGRGHVVRTAYDGTQAAAMAEELKPHACISDVMMPGMDGIELTMWLAEHQPQCRVLLISGKSLDADFTERLALYRHSATILHKPILPAKIFSFLATCDAESVSA